MENKQAKRSDRNKKSPAKESIISDKLDKLIEDLELSIKVNQILVGLMGGIKPGQKTLTDMQIVKLRNQGIKVKDIAKMQGISECAMSRKIQALKKEGLLDV